MKNESITPAQKLMEAIEMQKLANENFVSNYELYEVLMHRTAVLKMQHAQMCGAAVIKIIQEKYGCWLRNKELEAKALKLAIGERFGIGAEVTITDEGIILNVETIQSANTLLKAFRRHKAIIKANDYMNYSIFVPIRETQQL